MEPLFQKIPLAEDQSILIKDTFDTNFHFHSEYELIYFSKGAGECIIGDRISRYEKGNMFLIAPNLPHCFTGAIGSDSASLVIQFRHQAFQETIGNHPELYSINHLLAKAKKGLLFKPDSSLLDSKIIHSSGFERFIALLDILNKLSHSDDYHVLCGPAYTQNVKLKDYHRINEVYGYVADHFQSKISLEKIAGEMHLNVSSFCRYFKKITKKSFFTYLNEFRIGKACDMLRRSDKSVAVICYESGFDSISNFNRQFKKYTKSSPSTYRKHYSLKA
jgi:AraC-like DNA-binding protein/mannose-6-phosphate isomerase-like protein (cupin superfamily)